MSQQEQGKKWSQNTRNVTTGAKSEGGNKRRQHANPNHKKGTTWVGKKTNNRTEQSHSGRGCPQYPIKDSTAKAQRMPHNRSNPVKSPHSAGQNQSNRSGSSLIKKKVESALSPAVKEYYKNIQQSLDQRVDDEEERELFLTNVFEQLSTDLLDVAVDPSTGPMVERLMAVAPANYIVKYLKIFKRNLNTLCCTKAGTFVIQSCLCRASFFQSVESPNKKLEKHLAIFASTMINDADKLLQENMSYYIYRTMMEVLSGVHVKQTYSNKKGIQASAVIVEKPIKEHNRHQRYESHLSSLFGLFISTTNLAKLIETVCDPIRSFTVNVVLEVMKKINPVLFKVTCQDILACGYLYMPKDLSLAKAFTDRIASTFTCQFFKLLDDETLISLLEKNIAPRVTELIKDTAANYVLQACFTESISLERYECLLNVLEEHMALIVESSRAGIILHIVQGALRHPSKQIFVITLLLKAYKAEPDTLFSAISNLKPGEPMCYLSSIILQNLVKFQDNEIIYEGLMNMDASSLAGIATSSYGSYLLTAFLTSSRIIRKNKVAAIEKLKGHYAKLAIDKFGSRMVESFWDIATVPVRYAIAEELSGSISLIIQDYQYGRIVANKLRISEFKHNKQEWERWLQTRPRAAHQRFEMTTPVNPDRISTVKVEESKKDTDTPVDDDVPKSEETVPDSSNTTEESQPKKRRMKESTAKSKKQKKEAPKAAIDNVLDTVKALY